MHLYRLKTILSRRAAGIPLREAVIDSGRLRPILMTAGTIIIGLLPLTGWFVSIPALGPLLEAVGLAGGEGAEIRAPVAVTVIGGLTVVVKLANLVLVRHHYNRGHAARSLW